MKRKGYSLKMIKSKKATKNLKQDFLKLLRCPVSGMSLIQEGNILKPISGKTQYEINDSGIPLFVKDFSSSDTLIQQAHYDKIANAYIENLSYPHTQEYMRYLDNAWLSIINNERLKTIAEICCGRGESFQLLKNKVGCGVGVDVSVAMLESALKEHKEPHLFFLQGDATMLPLASNSFESVFIRGGIHHVNNREALFSEIYRILKPEGRFYFIEPVDDFILWRWIRKIIYRISPALDHKTESPLLYKETLSQLEKAGFKLPYWKTFGFFGCALFMNSDVLIFNRVFRFIPGIRSITRFFTKLDEWFLRIPFLKGSGLQVIGYAEK